MRGRDTFNQHVRPSLAQLLQHRAVDGEAPQASPLLVSLAYELNHNIAIIATIEGVLSASSHAIASTINHIIPLDSQKLSHV